MRNKKGFTLIELLIVIAIIGILSAALLPTVLNAPARGRDSARLGNMNSIVAALEAYNSDFGKYPANEGCVGADTETVFVNASDESVLDNYFSGGIAPQDPSGSREVTLDPGACVAAGLYYYKYVGEVGVAEYVIGTVMEIETNNNSDTNPDEIDDSSTDILACTTEPCDFYVLIK
ncbi:hypothetical protein C0416_04330 [bacterium]|nr:hypothetical protein [bacterium]